MDETTENNVRELQIPFPDDRDLDIEENGTEFEIFPAFLWNCPKSDPNYQMPSQKLISLLATEEISEHNRQKLKELLKEIGIDFGKHGLENEETRRNIEEEVLQYMQEHIKKIEKTFNEKMDRDSLHTDFQSTLLNQSKKVLAYLKQVNKILLEDDEEPFEINCTDMIHVCERFQGMRSVLLNFQKIEEELKEPYFTYNKELLEYYEAMRRLMHASTVNTQETAKILEFKDIKTIKDS